MNSKRFVHKYFLIYIFNVLLFTDFVLRLTRLLNHFENKFIKSTTADHLLTTKMFRFDYFFLCSGYDYGSDYRYDYGSGTGLLACFLFSIHYTSNECHSTIYHRLRYNKRKINEIHLTPVYALTLFFDSYLLIQSLCMQHVNVKVLTY